MLLPMKTTIKILTGLCLLLSGLKAQTSLVDSLRNIAGRVDKDSAAVLYTKIANVFTGVNSDSVRRYARIAEGLAAPHSEARGDIYIQMGNSYHMENKVDSALACYKRALDHFNRTGNEKGIGKVYQSFSIVKRTLGDAAGSIEDSQKSLEIYLKVNWQLGVVHTYNNIASAYNRMKNHEEAVRYGRLAFSASKQLNDSLKYFAMMSEYGSKLIFIDRTDSALYYLNAARPYLERNHMYNLLLPGYSNLAYALLVKPGKKDLEEARKALYKAREYAILAGAYDNLRFIYREMSRLYLKQGRPDSAEIYFTKTITLIDSLAMQEGIQKAKDIETHYETEKKELQLQKQALEIEAGQQESRTKTRLLLIGGLALLAIAVFAFFAYSNFLKVKRFNGIIQTQKKEVEDQKEQISLQKELIEEKQKQTIDSINYARRIQQAILTGPETWKSISEEHFIFFRPKDIVSGDFYWACRLPGDLFVFALADCTGHGVPGGFMSMLGNSFLNSIVMENKISRADEILNRLREKVISALEQQGSDDQKKDGMDIALCVWDKKNKILEFAGANNPLWISGGEGLREVRADKMPVGLYIGPLQPFTAHRLSLVSGDIIYLVTDGFADQFGGPRQKKFKYGPLKQLLMDSYSLSMSAQKERLESVLEDWKKETEQVDDISIIGIRV
jgi:serine phosphatase RsbU (regulator of sigma subunit)